MIHRFRVPTKARTDFIDITGNIQRELDTSEIRNGICLVFIPHTTAGVTINENADTDVRADIINALEQIVPWENRYRHFEGNSAAHIKASMVGFSCLIPFEDRRLVLGTWQGIYFCEFDGPRDRNVVVTLIGS